MTNSMTIDPLELSVLAHGVAMIAEEMGAVLVRSALSPNIRERRDASAALFDARGRMVAQAAHIPVHLGAMPDAVAAVRARDPQPGDVFLLNDPYHGGSHLPDLTLVAVVELQGEIGGVTGALGPTPPPRGAGTRGAASGAPGRPRGGVLSSARPPLSPRVTE